MCVRMRVYIRSRLVDSILSFGIVYLKAKMEPPCMPTYASVNICREINETYSTISSSQTRKCTANICGTIRDLRESRFSSSMSPDKKRKKEEKSSFTILF